MKLLRKVWRARTVIKFDGLIRDRQGRVVISLKGVEIVELEQTTGFPGKVFEEMLPVAEIVSEMEKAPEAFLKHTLDDEEVREHGQKATPKRAAEWLAGRIALKRSIRRVMATTDTGTISENNIRIIQDEQGKPDWRTISQAGAGNKQHFAFPFQWPGDGCGYGSRDV